ncbi:hypothetical protein BS47DRAFT_1315808 [Hydnum rufescens UP504]|uniref:5-hydroxyisourate hydrolase n=1 Tax=Hydnum rufescens UP504 TaxID=1448309 RepID=A0A9P6B1D2_9AGAM|nr:hypothetical protein BS47DRAFT_1315808 [Hydnum rufescens UP504]
MADRSPITCHVLDSTLGQPGRDIGIFLEHFDFRVGKFNLLGRGITDADGRCNTLLQPSQSLKAGMYKMTFQTGDYFVATKRESFYPLVEVTFHVAKAEDHYHIPLLLSPWSYTTYRGS